ncbi:MAG: DUF58 domain-containing protein [Acidimicrobiales bacterium]
MASAAVIGAGRLFGIFELYLVGAGGAALVIAATVAVWLARHRVAVARRLHPSRLHAGTTCRVTLELTNRGNRRTPMILLCDVIGGRDVTLGLEPLPPGGHAAPWYQFPAPRRGILGLGPLEAQVSDPFGLAAASNPAAPRIEVTVWPAVDDVVPPPHTHGDQPLAGTDHPTPMATLGEDFHSLRPYVPGDDLRRVHWRSSARRDDLVIRNDELPWQGRVTVLLDTRAGAHSPSTFEQAVSAAASIVTASARHRFLVRLATASGDDTGFAADFDHITALMDRLALVGLDDPGRRSAVLAAEPTLRRSLPASLEETTLLAAVLANLARPGSGGALVALLGGGDGAPVEELSALRGCYGNLTLVVFMPGAGPPARRRADVIVIDDANPFAPTWNKVMAGALR